MGKAIQVEEMADGEALKQKQVKEHKQKDKVVKDVSKNPDSYMKKFGCDMG